MPCTRTPRSRERQRDPAGADAELERGAVAGEFGEEVDGGIDGRGSNMLGRRLVVARCDALAEVILGHACTLSKPYACRASSNACSITQIWGQVLVAWERRPVTR